MSVTPIRIQGEWSEYLDANSQRSYFYNHVTQTTQWTAPSEWQIDASAAVATPTATVAAATSPTSSIQIIRVAPAAASTPLSPSANATVLAASSTQPSTPEVKHVLIFNDDGQQVPSGWTSTLDASSGKVYYIDTATNQTSWTLPDHIQNKLLPPTTHVTVSSLAAPSIPEYHRPSFTHVSSDALITSMAQVSLSSPLSPQIAVSLTTAAAAPNRDRASFAYAQDGQSLHFRSKSAGAFQSPLAPISDSAALQETASASSASSASAAQDVEPPSTQTCDDGHVYERILDAASGNYYYHDKTTNSTSWTAPTGWQFRRSKACSIISEEPEDANSPSFNRLRSMSAHQDVQSPLVGSTGYLSSSARVTFSAESDSDAPRKAYSTLVSSYSPATSGGRSVFSSVGPRGSFSMSAASKRSLSSQLQQDIHRFQLDSFAASHFSTFRTGRIFKKETPLQDVLSWQSEPIYKNLLLSAKSARSDALSAFKYIQQFMGDDKSTRKSPHQLVALLQELGIKNPPVRDEIFCQLCKQTTKNPVPESTLQGWKLFVCCASAFGPSVGFQEQLLQYVRCNFDGPADFASISKLAEFYVLKSTQLSLDKLVPLTIAQLESVLTRGIKSSMFSFSYSINRLMELQEVEDQLAGIEDGLSVPRVMVMLIEQIAALDGANTQGIFRLAAQKSEIQRVRTQIEMGESIDCKDPNVPADLLKIWFRNLPEPIIPIDSFDDCMKLADKPDEALHLIQNICTPCHLAVLDYLFRYLKDLSKYSAKTSMGIDNLALVFGPTLLRSKNQDPNFLLSVSNRQKQFLQGVVERWA